MYSLIAAAKARLPKSTNISLLHPSNIFCITVAPTIVGLKLPKFALNNSVHPENISSIPRSPTVNGLKSPNSAVINDVHPENIPCLSTTVSTPVSGIVIEYAKFTVVSALQSLNISSIVVTYLTFQFK